MPLAAIAAVAWTAMLAGEDRGALPGFCAAGLWSGLSLDRLTSAMALYSPAALVGQWLLMVAAMMMPMLVGPVAHVRARSLPGRRLQALAIFMAGYWAVWVACGAPIVTVVLAVHVMQPSPFVAAALLASVVLAWQCSPAKQHCLNHCHDRPALAVSGVRAHLDALRFGARQGAWCCGTCWAPMLIPLAMQQGHLIAMVATSVFLSAERLEKPSRPAWAIRWPSAICRLLWFRLKPLHGR